VERLIVGGLDVEFVEELEMNLATLKAVTTLEVATFFDLLVIDEGAVRAVQILYPDTF
jgi:hypothetical protein